MSELELTYVASYIEKQTKKAIYGLMEKIVRWSPS